MIRLILIVLLVAAFLLPTPVSAQEPAEILSARTENSKTFDLGNGQNAIRIYLNPIHYKDDYKDVSEPWKDIDTTIVNNRVDTAPYTLVIDPKTRTATMTDKKTQEVTTVQLADITKSVAAPSKAFLTSNYVTADRKMSWPEIAPGVDYEIVAERSRVRFSRIIKDENAYQAATFNIQGPNVTYLAMDNTGQPLAVQTFSKDGKIAESFTASKDQYPIRIDPVYSIADANNDAGGRTGATYWNVNWTVNPAGIENSSWKYFAGMIYENVAIAQGATVASATVTFTCGIDDSFAGTVTRTRLAAYDVDDAPNAFDTSANYWTWWAAHTTAVVDWDGLPKWTADTEYTSPDIKTVIQEIVDRGSWASGNDIMIFWNDLDNRSDGTATLRYSYTYDSDSSKTPYLTVTLNVPTVVTGSESDVTATTATLGGNITAAAATVTTRGFEWDTDSGAPYANSVSENGSFSTGAYTLGATGLPGASTIYWRAYATDSNGTGYGDEESFVTLAPLPEPPTDVTLTQTDVNTANVAWTKGAYAANTVIRYQEGSYPPTITDGYEFYNDTGVSDNASGLNLGTSTYFFRFWSTNATGTSETYADATIGGEQLNSLTLFLVFPGIMGMILLLVAVMPRKKNLLVTLAASLFWLAIGFWWIIDDPFSTLGLSGDYVDIFYYIPFMFFVIILLEYITCYNQVELKRTFGGREWTEFGTPPSTYQSGYDRYKEQLSGRLKPKHRRY